ncbi:hypothetical protein Bca101_016458 [Brassica carinata]
MSSDGVTTKRSSTEEESDSSVSKKLKFEDVDDTNMENESDTYSGQALSVETEEDERVVTLQDPEPEWDKDSFDGYECYDPEDRESFSNDEEYDLRRVPRDFYEEDPFRSIFPLTDLEKRFRNMTTREYLADIASLCVKKLNEEKGTTVELGSIVRGNLKAGDGWKLYVTFMAREYPDGPLVEYQAKAMDFAGGTEPPFPILCRPAPTMS